MRLTCVPLVAASRSAGVGDELFEDRLVDAAGGLDGSVRRHELQCRLERHVEPGEHVAGIVGDLGEGQTVTVDEVLEGVLGPGPGDTDEVDLICITEGDLFDRRGFTIADASSGRPEPERRGLVAERLGVEFTSTHQRSGEVQDSGRGVAAALPAIAGCRGRCVGRTVSGTVGRIAAAGGDGEPGDDRQRTQAGGEGGRTRGHGGDGTETPRSGQDARTTFRIR